MSRPIKWTEEMINQAIEMRANGAGCLAIGKMLGIGKSTVANYIARYWPVFHPREPVAEGENPARRHYIGNERWVERVAHTTVSSAVVSLPRVSILNGKEA